MDKIRIEIPPGMELRKAASYACDTATEKGCAVEFDFNGVGCLVRSCDDSDRVADYIWRKMQQRQIPAPTGIEKSVCEDIAARQQKGIAKYGKTVAESPDDMLQHAYEEALDLAVYLKAEITKRKLQP